MYRDWRDDAGSHHCKAFLWVFPSFPLIGAVINMLLAEQVDAISVLAEFLCFWTAMLEQLPVFGLHEIAYHHKLYTVGPRAPKYRQEQGKKCLLTC